MHIYQLTGENSVGIRMDLCVSESMEVLQESAQFALSWGAKHLLVSVWQNGKHAHTVGWDGFEARDWLARK